MKIKRKGFTDLRVDVKIQPSTFNIQHFIVLILTTGIWQLATGNSHAQDLLKSLQEAFVKVAQQAEPAVVSINTTKVIKRKIQIEQGSQEFRDFVERYYGWKPPTKEETKTQPYNLGSGVIIDAKAGYVLTSFHVIEGADEIQVTLFNGKTYQAKIAGEDGEKDIALLKIVNPPSDLKAAKLGDSDRVRVGEWAVAMGNPYGSYMRDKKGSLAYQPTVTVGVISALGRSLRVEGQWYENLIQTDAAINRGNSGGPLLNINGEVIGINTAILSPPVGNIPFMGNIGIGFAIPINEAKNVLPDLLSHGGLPRGWLGVSMQSLDEELAKRYGLKTTQGALVNCVFKGSPADNAGLTVGDVVLKLNEITIKNKEHLQQMVQNLTPGTKATLGLSHRLEKKSVPVTIKEQTKNAILKTWRGICVSAITEEILGDFSYLENKKGVLVSEVSENSPADRQGVVIGDVVKEINGAAVRDILDFQKIVVNMGITKNARIIIKRAGKTQSYILEPD